MLTPKQYKLFEIIHQKLQKTGVSPSFEEMKAALGLKSKSGIHRLISSLEERGFIKHLPNKARALKITKFPENYHQPKNTPANRNQKRSESLKPVNKVANENSPEMLDIPLYGKIAAGTPIEAIRDTSENISVASNLLGYGEHYSLVVEGDSMVDAGIYDGDSIVIKRTDTAQDGEIVVALIDNNEVTLKYLWKKDSQIVLEPANPHYKPKTLDPDQVQIQGVMALLLRKY